MRRLGAIMIIARLIVAANAATPDEWLTTYERSGYRETARYDSTVAFCRRLDEASPLVTYQSFGTSPEGRELPLLFVQTDTVSKDQPLLLILAGIHAGEIDGKDAGLMLIRDAVILREHGDLFDGVRVAFVPIFNVDGHERFSAHSRINQNGPREMGWRTSGQNLNLNRDWLKADAPEMRSLLAEIARLQPDVLIDIHVTDGADFQYVITYSLNEHENGLPPVRAFNREIFLPAVKARMKDAGYDFVPQPFFRGRIPESGWVSPVFGPRFSTGYGTLINRPSLLVETHSLKDYHTRVTATYRLLKSAIEVIKPHGKALREANRQADSLAQALSEKPYHLAWDLSPDSQMVDFLGMDYRFERSEISGDSVIGWGQTPRTYRIPFFERATPQDTLRAPWAYLIPPAWLSILQPTLEAHGIPVETLREPLSLRVEQFRLHDVTFAKKPYEGRFRVSFTTEPQRAMVRFPAGTGVVRLNHPRAQVAIHLLEPRSEDSFVQWGFLNQIFEQKEYFEDYVMDTLAARMRRESPALSSEFHERLERDSAFAGDAYARWQFFYERSPYWDTRKNLYPVARVVDEVEYRRLLAARAGSESLAR